MAPPHQDPLPRSKGPKDLGSKIQGGETAKDEKRGSLARAPSAPSQKPASSPSPSSRRPLRAAKSEKAAKSELTLPPPRFDSAPRAAKQRPPVVQVPKPVSSRPASRDAPSGSGSPMSRSVMLPRTPASAASQSPRTQRTSFSLSSRGGKAAGGPATTATPSSTAASTGSLTSSLRRKSIPEVVKRTVPQISLEGLSKDAIAEIEEVKGQWGLSQAVTNVAKATVKLGFVSDIEKEFDALMHLGEPARPMAELDMIEDCNTWELLLGSRSQNRCFTFGIDAHGQLGQGVSSRHNLEKNVANIRPPQAVKDGQRFVQVACGDHHAAALSDDGVLFQWGNNSSGQLGLVSRTQAAVPRSEHVVLPSLIADQQLTRNPSVSSALTTSGSIDSETLGSKDFASVEVSFEEQLENNLCTKILSKGPVSRPQLPKAGTIASSPLRCWMGVPVTCVACGMAHTVAALKYSGVLVWGANDAGQLGLGDTENRRQPVLVPALSKRKVISLSAGKAHNLAIDYDMFLWAWGSNRSGQCGKLDQEIMTPVQVRLPECDGFPEQVAAGQAHSLVATSDGELYSWGYDAWGALGHGPREGSGIIFPNPAKIENVPPCFKVAASSVSMAITQDGQLLVWGCHKWISHPKREDQDKRVPMPLDWMKDEKITSVACSRETAIAFSENGAIHAWGRKQKVFFSKESGQDGRETAVAAGDPGTLTPVQLRGDGVSELRHGIVMEAACGDGFYALLNEREMWKVPYAVLKRAIHAVWEKYRTAHVVLGKVRTRRGVNEEDDEFMPFQIFVLLAKEAGLVSNVVGLHELIDMYEETAREALRTKRRLPTFLKIAFAGVTKSKSIKSSGTMGLWGSTISALNSQTEEDDGPVPANKSPESGLIKPIAKRKTQAQAQVFGAGGKMKALSQAIAQDMQARTTLLEQPISFAQGLGILIKLANKHVPDEHDEMELLRIVAGQMGCLKDRALEGPSFLLRQSCSPGLAKAVVEPSISTILLRVYAYLLSDTPDRDDLNLKVEDLKMAMKALGGSVGITAMKMATFVREAGIVPKVVAQYISFVQQQEDPELYDMAQYVAMSSSRLDGKAVESKINKDALDHRDRVLADTLITLHGPVPKLNPDCLDFEDFVSVLLILVTIKSYCNNNRVVIDEDDAPDNAMQQQTFNHYMDRVKRYREKKLHPWKFFDRPRSEAELEQEADRIFSMYCTLDTTSYNVEIELKSFMKLVKDSKILDNRVTTVRADIMFRGAVNEVRHRQAEEEALSRRGSRRYRMDHLSQPKGGSGSDNDTSPTRQRPFTGSSAPDSRGSSSRLVSRRSSLNRSHRLKKKGPEEAKKLTDVLKKSELGTLIRTMKDGDKQSGAGNMQVASVALAAAALAKKASGPIDGRSKLKMKAAKAASSIPKQHLYGRSPSKAHSDRALRASVLVAARADEDPMHQAIQFDKQANMSDKHSNQRFIQRKLSIEERGSIGQTGVQTEKLPNALARQRFGKLLRDIAQLKYPKERDPWRTLVEKHFLSLSNSALERYDQYMEQLLEPAVVDMAESYSAALQKVFKMYCTMDDRLTYGRLTMTWAMMEEANQTLSFQEYRIFANDYGIVPGLLSIKELEMIFRRANFSENSEDLILNMNFAEFVDSLCLIALFAFGKAELKAHYPTTLDKIQAFFSFMGFELGRADPKSEAEKEAEDEKAYQFWWDLLSGMGFDADDDLEDESSSKTWYYNNTLAYPMCLIPEIVSAPEDCPEEIVELLEEADKLHMEGKFAESLSSYSTANQVWSRITAEKQLTRSRDLLPETKLFFAAAMGGVLQSNGQDAAAMDMYKAAEKEVRKLPDDHPDTAFLHSLIGASAYHMRQNEEAFRSFVRAKVMRDFLPSLGKDHVETAVANNNLACILDRGGEVGKAMYLLRDAHKVLLKHLGGNHPRTMIVERNLSHLKHRTFSFNELSAPWEMHPANVLAGKRAKSGRRSSGKASAAKKSSDPIRRLERLHMRIEKKGIKLDPMASGSESARSMSAAAGAELSSQYQKMQSAVERTRLGLYKDAPGEVLSGEGEINLASELVMILGYNIRLPEPIKKLRVDRVKVRTTKKFAEQIKSRGRRNSISATGEITYEDFRDSEGNLVSSVGLKKDKKQVKKQKRKGGLRKRRSRSSLKHNFSESDTDSD